MTAVPVEMTTRWPGALAQIPLRALRKAGAARKWVLLTLAIITEVAATLALRASQDQPAWLALVVVGYGVAFTMLALVLREGLPVGVTYGIWGASGTALTAVLGAVIFRDPFTWPIVAGIVLIIAGVLFIELGSRPVGPTP